MPFLLLVPPFVTRCHSLSFPVTRCQSLSLAVSLVVIRRSTRCHSLSLVVPLVITRCHSLSLDVPLACLFINDQIKHISFRRYCMFPKEKNSVHLTLSICFIYCVHNRDSFLLCALYSNYTKMQSIMPMVKSIWF